MNVNDGYVNGELAQARCKIQELEDDLHEVRIANRFLIKDNEGAKLVNTQLDGEIERGDARVKELELLVESQKICIRDLRAANGKLNEEVAAFRKENERLVDMVSADPHEGPDPDTPAEELIVMINLLRTQLEDTIEQKDAEEERACEAESLLGAAEKGRDEAMNKLVVVEQERDDSRETVSKYARRAYAAEAELRRLTEGLPPSQSVPPSYGQIADLTRENRRLRDMIIDLHVQLLDRKEAIEVLTRTLRAGLETLSEKTGVDPVVHPI